MARWKARIRLPIRHNWTFFAGSYRWGATRQNLSWLLGGGRSVWAKISEGRGRPWGIFFGFYKTRHILLSDSANCTVLSAVVLTQYGRVTDGQTDRQTDGIAVASRALAMRALRPAVKTKRTQRVIWLGLDWAHNNVKISLKRCPNSQKWTLRACSHQPMVAVFIRQSSNVTYLKTLLVALGRVRCRKEAQEHEGRSNIIQIYRCTVVREFVPAQLQRNMPLHSTVTEELG